MKIDRHKPNSRVACVKLRRTVFPWLLISGLLWLSFPFFVTAADESKPVVSQPRETVGPATAPPESTSQAVNLLRQVLEQIVHGPAFDAKVREIVWTAGREVVGVGTYEQAGGGTGRFHLQITMHDGDGKHRLQQISDGRLAWTRIEIAGGVSLRRVDVGRLDEWVQDADKTPYLPPRLLVGGWTEILSTIERDYLLRVDSATLKGEPFWVITGDLRRQVRDQIMAESKRQDWPELHPTRVRVAVRAKPEADTGFGQGLPVRMEFWSDPLATPATGGPSDQNSKRRMITLIELYSLRPISPPPHERFRFDNQDAEVNFINETDRYIQMYGIRLTDRERRQLRR